MSESKSIESGIYVIRCTANGKVYVGSAADFNGRWSHHRRRLLLGLHDNPILQSAYDKYGPDAFLYEVLEKLPLDKETLLAREQHYIDHFKATDRKHGFNLRLIATSNLGMKATEEHRAKIAAALSGKAKSKEHIAKMSATKLGRKDSVETLARKSAAQRGKIQPPEAIAKTAAALRGRPQSAKHRANAFRFKGRTHTAESRAKMSASRTGQKHSEATKAKMRESWRCRRKQGREVQGLLFN